ncbi:hypothetical protein CXF74_06560 [Psychromonas sp. Urea-02u-13]|nr:hypothetical protein CXF74_06560 [Psychromonas sp. Urea-02u-13]
MFSGSARFRKWDFSPAGFVDSVTTASLKAHFQVIFASPLFRKWDFSPAGVVDSATTASLKAHFQMNVAVEYHFLEVGLQSCSVLALATNAQQRHPLLAP